MRRYLGNVVYLAGWLAWAWFIIMLVEYPPQKGAPWSELWQHVLGWCLVLLVFTAGFLIPVPAPLGSGIVPLPLADPVVQVMTDWILLLFPIIYFSLFLRGRWGVWYCWAWYGLALCCHILKKCIQHWSAGQMKKDTYTAHPELASVLEYEASTAPSEPWVSHAPMLGRLLLFVSIRKHYTEVKVPVEDNGGCLSSQHIVMDIWDNDEDTGPKPVLFFIHGGAWVAGNHRRHAVIGFINRMMRRGWIVVSCSYRKNKWPVHANDCAAGLRWVKDHIAEYGGDIEKGIVMCGASAGGQIAALLTAATVIEQDHCPRGLDKVQGLVRGVKVRAFLGWYPALDPKDDCGEGVNWPWGESLMEWFFKVTVRPSCGWESVQPTWLMRSANCRDFPPTLILHGTHDSVVPFGHSAFFFDELRRVRTHNDDVLLPMNFVRHTYELAPSATLDTSINVAAAWLHLINTR